MKPEAVELNVESLVEKTIAHHGAKRDSVIPVLSEINQAVGYVPSATLPEIRRRLNDPAEGVFLGDSHLYSAVSFYRLLSLEPLGRHVIRFCESAPCHVMGGRQVFRAVQDELNLKPNETSPDKKWSLLLTSCLGVCGVGPVLLVDDDIYGNLSPEQVPDILARYD